MKIKNLVVPALLLCLGHSYGNAQTALNFDAVNDKVDCGTSINIANGSFTFEIWAQSTPSASSQHFFSMGSSVTSQGLHTRIEPSGAVKFGFWSNDVVSTPQATSTDGLWHHYAFTYNHISNTQRIYVDGTEIVSNISSGDFTGTGTLNIGVMEIAGFGPLEYWNGNLDQFRVWDHERSSTEINDNMGICLTGSETGLLALYDFENGTGSSTLTDLTGNGNTGTLTNMDPSTDWVSGYACSGCNIAQQTITEADFSICSADDTLVNLNSSEVGISYYLRDDADDSILDGPISGTGSAISFNTGTLTTTTTMNVYAQSAASLSDGLDFDGSNDQAIGSDVGFPAGSSNRTLETWIRITTPPDGHEMAIMYGSPAGGQYCGIGIHPSGRAFFWGFGADLQGMSTITDGNWYHVAATYDGTRVRLYVNGVLENSQNLALNTVLDGNFQLGAETGSFLGGSIDKVSIWDYMKSDAEIAESVNKCYTGSETGLVALWNLDDGTGSSIATDATGNGHNATLTNMDPSTDWVSGSSCYDCDLEMTDMITITIGDNTAPIADIATLSDVTAECEVTALTAPTATDNCAGPITGTHNATLPITAQGTTTVTWTYDDGNGNTTTQTQDVVINDITAPVADVATLSDVTAECSVTALTAPTANDNCAGAITGTHNATLPITAQGTTTVTWTYDDGNGNTSTQTQDVVINDITAPVPSNATLSDVTAECEVTALTAPTANDNCAGAITGTHNTTLPITAQGTTTVTWTYDDGNGNTSTQTQDVVINDITAPVADVATLSDITDECSVTALTAPTANDNCAGAITGTHNATLPITAQGTTTVTWTYDDGNGNTSTQTQDVVINDITAPVADVATLSDITAECEVTALSDPTASDNCAGPITGTHNATLPITAQGTTTVIWTYDDGNGNTSTQTQDVVISDITAPTPDIATLADATGECSVTVSAPTATDNCAGTITGTTTDPTSYSVQGTYTITWTYDDGNGNSVTQNQTVIVDDITAPTITAPSDVNVLANALNCSASGVTLGTPVTTDNCNVASVTDDAPATFPLGSTTVTWTVTDDAGNTTTDTQIITVSSDLAVSNLTSVDVDCNGASTGSIDITVGGGTAPFNFDWDNDGTGDNDDTEDLTGLAAGTYNGVVTDANGCTDGGSVIINEPTPILITIDATTSPSNCGAADGAIDVTTTGGTPSYTFLWDDAGLTTTEDIMSLTAGAYTLTVTDANGCIESASASLSDPGGPIVVIDSTTAILCGGDSTGAVYTTVTGGTAPILIDWDNDGTGDNDDIDDITMLVGGTYNMVVTDANNCVASVSQVLTAPDTLTLAGAVTNVTCNGDDDGAIDIVVGGGTVSGAYTFDWNNDGTGDNDDTEDLSGLSGATLIVVVMDDNMCVVTDTFNVTEPDSLIGTTVGTDEIAGNDGAIDLTVTGGTSSYTYQWDDAANSTTEDLSGLVAGTYTVIVTDANGCSDTIVTTIGSQVGLASFDAIDVSLYPNPNKGSFNLLFDRHIDGQIIIVDAAGRLIFDRNVSSNAAEIQLEDVETGLYNAIIITDSGKSIIRFIVE